MVVLYYVLLASTLKLTSSSDMSPVILEPSGTIALCPGGRMDFVCTTNFNIHQWSISIPSSNGRTERSQDMSYISPDVLNVTVAGKTFSVTRNSARNQSLPLTTTLTADNMTVDLNGAEFQCTDIMENVTSTATICIITPNNVYLNVSNVFMTEVERFDEEYVTVMLKRIPDDSILNYISANSTPHLDIRFNETKTNKLRITYNINYSVSVSALLCDHVVSTAHLDLHFVKCESSLHPISVNTVDNPLLAVVDRVPTLEGSNVTFSCPPGLVLVGPNSSTCDNEGEWEPDPKEVSCKETGSTSVGLRHTSIIIVAVSISVTTFVIVIFIVGFTCSFTWHKCITKSSRASDAQLNQSEPIYSECTYPLKISQQEETPEMVGNVAYGLVK